MSNDSTFGEMHSVADLDLSQPENECIFIL